MPYCVNCDVELAKSELRCPLCGAPAVDPDHPGSAVSYAPPPDFSLPRQEPKRGRVTLLILLSGLFLLPIIICTFYHVSLLSDAKWPAILSGGFVAAYVMVVIPAVLRTKPLPQLLIDLAAAELYAYYIAGTLDAAWFPSFAFPVILVPFLVALFLLLFHMAVGLERLKTAALSLLAAGLYCLFLEWRINVVFLDRTRFVWAQYPLIVLVALSFIFFLISRDEVLKARLARRFFI